MNTLTEPLGQVLDRVPAGWRPLLDVWRGSEPGRALIEFVAARLAAAATIYPAQVLHALELTPRDTVRVVILGQDPYHRADQAEGLAFSVAAGLRLPPSLRNVFKELQRDLGLGLPTSGHLGSWARQGVLLLNATLTVEDGRPGAHANQGWEALTDALIAAIAGDGKPTVFMLWGSHAQAKAPLLLGWPRCYVLRANHPSPLSATRGPLPFIGSGHFGAANRFLAGEGLPPIDWRIA